MTTSSMLSPSLTLVKIMLLLKIVSLSFMHTVQPAQQLSDSRLRQLSDSCPTVSDSRPTVVRQSSDSASDSQDGARAPSQSDSRPTVVRQSDSCPTVTSDSVRQCPTVPTVFPTVPTVPTARAQPKFTVAPNQCLSQGTFHSG